MLLQQAQSLDTMPGDDASRGPPRLTSLWHLALGWSARPLALTTNLNRGSQHVQFAAQTLVIQAKGARYVRWYRDRSHQC
jgi:hypothetical protein